MNVGYGDHRITDTIQRASSQVSFAHTIELSLGKCMRTMFFGHSGSDANDTNLKLAISHSEAASAKEVQYLATVAIT